MEEDPNNTVAPNTKIGPGTDPNTIDTVANKAKPDLANDPGIDTTEATQQKSERIRLHFQVSGADVVTGSGGKVKQVTMKPVSDMLDTNTVLSDKNDFGQVSLTISNAELFDHFQAGKPFYVDITPVKAPDDTVTEIK